MYVLMVKMLADNVCSDGEMLTDNACSDGEMLMQTPTGEFYIKWNSIRKFVTCVVEHSLSSNY